jgi:protein-tyrosine phosphatase
LAPYVDIHAHLLPGIDDGPPDLAASLDMARAAMGAGITTIVATPHLRSDFPRVVVEELDTRCAGFRETLARSDVELDVISGAEVSVAWAMEATDEQLRLASVGQRGTDILIETPTSTLTGFLTVLDILRGHRLRVTIAHPERSRQFQRSPVELLQIASEGVVLQLNSDSLLAPARRSRAARLARQLCTDDVVAVVASDGHRGTSRRPVTALALAADELARIVGPDRARWMTSIAPGALVAGQPIPPPPAAAVPRRWPARLGGLGGRR